MIGAARPGPDPPGRTREAGKREAWKRDGLPNRRHDVVDHVRRDIRTLVSYTTGEQQPGFIKLNTNECAYDPSPRVRAALGAIADESLRLYPDPHARALREMAASRFSVEADQIIAGNGSDDCLTILYRTFLSPGDRVACPWPSYGLYDALAGIQGVEVVHVPYCDRRRAEPARGLTSTGARWYRRHPNTPPHATPVPSWAAG